MASPLLRPILMGQSATPCTSAEYSVHPPLYLFAPFRYEAMDGQCLYLIEPRDKEWMLNISLDLSLGISNVEKT